MKVDYEALSLLAHACASKIDAESITEPQSDSIDSENISEDKLKIEKLEAKIKDLQLENNQLIVRIETLSKMVFALDSSVRYHDSAPNSLTYRVAS